MTELKDKKCVPCEGGVAPLTKEEVKNKLDAIPEWKTDASGHQLIERNFNFKNYYQTMAFVNAIAWLAHQENHHPDLEVSYNHCRVRYSTHAIGGLSENDFICAAKVDTLLRQS